MKLLSFILCLSFSLPSFAVFLYEPANCRKQSFMSDKEHVCVSPLYNGGPRNIGVASQITFSCNVDIHFVAEEEFPEEYKTQEYAKSLLPTFGIIYLDRNNSNLSNWITIEEYINLFDQDNLNTKLENAPDCLKEAFTGNFENKPSELEVVLAHAFQSYAKFRIIAEGSPSPESLARSN